MKQDLELRTSNTSLSAFEQKVQTVEAGMLKEEQASCPVVHRFGPGIYIREVTLPAGILAIGHHQKTTHMNVMLKGKVSIVNPDSTISLLEAPLTVVLPPGRKVGYVHETVVWQNIYATEETDIEKLEEMFLEKSQAYLTHEEETAKLLLEHNTEDKKDYELLLKEYGFTEEIVKQQSENLEDQRGMPYGSYGWIVGSSKIEGKGIIASNFYNTGDLIGEARIDGLRTPLGRYTNHSKNPNAKMVLKDNGDIDLVAVSSIKGSYGGKLGDEITIDYRQALQLSGLKPI